MKQRKYDLHYWLEEWILPLGGIALVILFIVYIANL